MKAFPSIDWDSQIESKNNQLTPISSGMDLRDYFAAKCIRLFLSEGSFNSAEAAAKTAYEYADAMMEARVQ